MDNRLLSLDDMVIFVAAVFFVRLSTILCNESSLRDSIVEMVQATSIVGGYQSTRTGHAGIRFEEFAFIPL